MKTDLVELQSKRVFFRLSPRSGESRQHPLGSQFHEVRFHTRHFELAFQSPLKKPGMKPNVVQLRSKRVFFRLSPRSGRKSKNTRWDRNSTRFGFIPGILPWAFPSPGQKAGYETERRPIAFKTRFFDFPHRGRNEKTPLGSNSTRSVSYHHFEWAFPSRAKRRVDERRPIAFKTRFFDFPPSGRNVTTPLGSNSTRSVSYPAFCPAWKSPLKMVV